MSIQDEQGVKDEDREKDGDGQDGVVEFDERRAKMERLRAEGIDPYPPVSLPDRTLIKHVIERTNPQRSRPASTPS